jgi:acetyl-CoA carboxylase biotin carboxyl carrier protein
MRLIKSEVAGTVWKIEAAVGQAVAEGEVMIILECMKMEIPVEAPTLGRVVQILVAEGQAVGEDQPLAALEEG